MYCIVQWNLWYVACEPGLVLSTVTPLVITKVKIANGVTVLGPVHTWITSRNKSFPGHSVDATLPDFFSLISKLKKL